jgi:hypothetical protein
MTQRNFEINGCGLIKALSRNLLEGTKENQKNMSEAGFLVKMNQRDSLGQL